MRKPWHWLRPALWRPHRISTPASSEGLAAQAAEHEDGATAAILRNLGAETAFGPSKQRGGKGNVSKWPFEEGKPQGEPTEDGGDTVEPKLAVARLPAEAKR